MAKNVSGIPVIITLASKKNPTPLRSSLTPSKLDQSEASVAYVLAIKRTVFDLGEGGLFKRLIKEV